MPVVLPIMTRQTAYAFVEGFYPVHGLSVLGVDNAALQFSGR